MPVSIPNDVKKIKISQIKVDKDYIFSHQIFGVFGGKVLAVGQGWVDLEVIGGNSHFGFLTDNIIGVWRFNNNKTEDKNYDRW